MKSIQAIYTRLWKGGMLAAMLVLMPLTTRLLDAAQPASSADTKGVPDGLVPAGARRQAPGFTLTDARGQMVRLSDYKGKVVLLDFWATWCGGCKVEIPWYVEFEQRYRDQGLAVIGVAMDEGGMKVVKPFLEQKHIDYPVVIGDEAFMQRYSHESLPLTLLIDRDGRIAESHSGIVDKSSFENHIQQLLR